MRSDKAPFYLDCYESFGWQQDENFPMQETKNTVLIRLKRDRKLVNRTELTRLQRSFEAGMDEITALDVVSMTPIEALNKLFELKEKARRI